LVVMLIPELFPEVRNSTLLTFTVSVFVTGVTTGVEPESELQAKNPKKATVKMTHII